MARGFWTCQRVSDGFRCRRVNPNIKRKCQRCGKSRPPRKRPEHTRILDMPYGDWVVFNGGEHCGICGRKPSANRRLDRDHCHRTGERRGLLCARCNRALPSWITADWLRAAIRYLEPKEGQ